MNHPPNTRSRKLGRHLKSSAGAFDLPSILVGVVVVGILTAGVMAAIFGVIPFAQVNAAKQDLAAINTAQGVTYAKDGQTYKDLAGLDGAGLVSGLDAEKATVTTSDAGKGFTAIVTAGNGEKWFITHDDPTPRKWEEQSADLPPSGLNPEAWASEYCTTNIVTGALKQSPNAHPGMLEIYKQEFGMPYDQVLIQEFMDFMTTGFPEYSAMEERVGNDIGRHKPAFHDIEDIFFAGLEGMTTPDSTTLAAAHSAYAAGLDAWMMSFCHNYPGPGEEVPEMEPHPSHPETFAPDRWVFAELGTAHPFTIGFTLPGTADDFTITYDFSKVPGVVGTPRYEIVNGIPYWSLTLDPGTAGWGEVINSEFSIRISHSDGLPDWHYSGVRDFSLRDR